MDRQNSNTTIIKLQTWNQKNVKAQHVRDETHNTTRYGHLFTKTTNKMLYEQLLGERNDALQTLQACTKGSHNNFRHMSSEATWHHERLRRRSRKRLGCFRL